MNANPLARDIQVRPMELCEADTRSRTITFHVRENFGDGKDAFGLVLHDPAAERDNAMKIFGQALDVITGLQDAATSVERWVTLAPQVNPASLTNTD